MLAAVTSGLALAAQSKPLPLTARVIAHGEFAGFGPFGPAHLATYHSARAWVVLDTSLTPAQISNADSALHREGFVALVAEQLGSRAPNRGGLSWVAELGSPAGARAEVARVVSTTRANSHPFARFSVTGIPGAVGFWSGTASQGGENIVFADGLFAYLIGDGWGSAGKSVRPALIAAAHTLYKRVHGRPG
jgi:hypothetical protein